MATQVIREIPDVAMLIARQTQTPGSALSAQQQSASQILSTFGPAAGYAAVFMGLFLVFRRWYPMVYSPRTYNSAIPENERSPPAPTGLFDWFSAYLKVPDTVVLNNQETLDGFLFLRLIRLSVISCLIGCIITFPIIIPLNATGSGGMKQFSKLTWSNVASPDQPNSYYKYYAHVFCAWIYLGYIVYSITRESLFYINLRQAYLVSPLYSNRISSRTVLFMSVPKKYLDEQVLRELLGRELVKHVWIPLITDDLEDAVNERDNMLSKLENAEIDLIKAANAARNKASKNGEEIPMKDIIAKDLGDESGSIAGHWVKPEERPTHRLGPWGLWGTKVDTINWCREHLPESLETVRKLQDKHKALDGKTKNSAFVEFYTLKDAQSAFQALTHHQPLHMAPRYIGMSPDEIIWYNLRTKWWERVIRFLASVAIQVATIVAWSFPVAFIATISNINYLVTLSPFRWLSFIQKLGVLTGVITGLLPSILLSALMSLLPIYLRLLARLGGDPTLSAVEYTVQNSYYWFYIIQCFVVTTLSTGAIQAVTEIIRNPAQLVSILANSLPNASNFYLAYFITQGLGVVSQLMLGPVTLALYIIFSKLLDGTPRKKFKRFLNLSMPNLGTFYPVNTALYVIAISYSCIAPLVLAFAMIGLYLFYLAYRYNFIYRYQVHFDMKGRMYARALQQVFVGVYLANLCMIGLFAIKLGESKIVLGPMILMIVSLIFTVLFHLSLNTALAPLLSYLPKTLETEERRLLAQEGLEADVEDEAGEATMRSTSVSTKSQYYASTGETSLHSPADAEKSRVRRILTNLDQSLPVEKQSNFFMRWLRPDKFTDYYTLRKMVPRTAFEIEYTAEEERDAYFHPSVKSEPNVLWVPRDDLGVSAQEVRHTSSVTPITDRGAVLTEKGDVVWESEKAFEAPIYEPRVYY